MNNKDQFTNTNNLENNLNNNMQFEFDFAMCHWSYLC